MYEGYYGFNEKPFNKTPDPRFLFMSRSHEEAFARLQYAVEEREIAVLTGGIGCGKTTLTRLLIDSLGDRFRVVLIVNPRLTSFDFIKTVSLRLECPATLNRKSDIIDAVYARLFEDYKSGISTVIIVDEAHLIPYRETFEEIRLLTNFQMDDSNLLSLILVGQPELRKKLDLRSLAALRQRIGIYYHLEPIGEDEIRGYIEHRSRVGGREEPLFTDDALTAVYKFSGGVPRVINSIVTMAMLDGIAKDAVVIDGIIVSSAAKEIGLNGHC